MTKVDLSPEAITRRLRQVEELRRLCLSLGRARQVKPGAKEQDDGRPPSH